MLRRGIYRSVLVNAYMISLAVIHNQAQPALSAPGLAKRRPAFSASGEISDKQSREKQRQAGKLFQNSRWNEAIIAYSGILQAHPSNARILVNRGICYCRVKNYGKAIEDFNAALKIDEKSDRAYQHRGYAFYHLGKFKATISDESKAIQLNPQNRLAYRDRAQAYAQLGQFNLAQKDYVVQQKLYRATREYYAAMEMQHNGQFSKALNIFENSEKEHHGMFHPNIRRAAIYTKLGMYNEAVAVCTQYIKDHPKSFEARKLRAINYLQLGELVQATDDADQAIKVEPDAIEPYYVKARAAIYNKKYDVAVANYSAILRLRPDKELAARLERADAYCALGNYNLAISDYDFLARVDSNDETIYYHRAQAFLKSHQLDKAITDLKKFVKLAPNDPIAHMSLADALFQAKKYSESLNQYTNAIRLDAASPTLYDARAAAYDKCNDSVLAKKDRKKARQLRAID
jgi:tetratricopeptide (TPR) repeat protein